MRRKINQKENDKNYRKHPNVGSVIQKNTGSGLRDPLLSVILMNSFNVPIIMFYIPFFQKNDFNKFYLTFRLYMRLSLLLKYTTACHFKK